MEGHSGALTGSDAGPAVAPSDVHLADPALAASAGGGAGTAATTAAAPGAAGGLPSSPPSSLGSAPLPSGGHSGASSHFPDGHLHRTQLAVSAGFPGDVPGGSDPRQPTGTASSGSSQQASLGAPGQQMGSAPGPAYDASTGAYAIPNGGGMYAPPMQQQGMYSHPGMLPISNQGSMNPSLGSQTYSQQMLLSNPAGSGSGVTSSGLASAFGGSGGYAAAAGAAAVAAAAAAAYGSNGQHYITPNDSSMLTASFRHNSYTTTFPAGSNGLSGVVNSAPSYKMGYSLQQQRPDLGKDVSCSSPMICVVATKDGAPDALPLPVQNLRFQVQCHISMAFVTVQLLCSYPAEWREAPLILAMPKSADTSITNLSVANLVRPSVFATAVVSNDDAKKAGVQGIRDGEEEDQDDTLDPAPDPELFLLPLPQGLPGDQYKVTLSYFHPLLFEDGRYLLRLPTCLPPVAVALDASPNSLVEVGVTINSGISDRVDWTCPSHPVAVVAEQPGSVALQADAVLRPWDNTDFIVGFKVWRDEIQASVHVEPPTHGSPTPTHPDPARGTFCMSISPPGPEASAAFPRSVIFLLDRSGSMRGEPMAYAKNALLSGMQLLSARDEFTVVAFDHEQVWWTDVLTDATPEAVQSCVRWIASDVTARGTTDIGGPLRRALQVIQQARFLPFIFMFTDGCVDDERDICIRLRDHMERLTATSAAQREALAAAAAAQAAGAGMEAAAEALAAAALLTNEKTPRVCTFGIGPYCNHYFLKQLSTIGKGLFDVAFRPHAIQIQMQRMLAAAALPLLADVTLRVQGLTSCELFPFPIPDLFCGLPLLVAGKYQGDWPQTATLTGHLPSGRIWEQEIVSQPAGALPLQQAFVKQQLDHMTAEAWMAGNPGHMLKKVIDMSINSGVVCAHTCMVAFETTPDRYAQLQSQSPQQRRKKIVKYAVGGAAGMVVVGGVVAALVFGNVAATMANLPVGDAMQLHDLGTVFSEMGAGMDCCAGCDCAGCGDCAVC